MANENRAIPSEIRGLFKTREFDTTIPDNYKLKNYRDKDRVDKLMDSIVNGARLAALGQEANEHDILLAEAGDNPGMWYTIKPLLGGMPQTRLEILIALIEKAGEEIDTLDDTDPRGRYSTEYRVGGYSLRVISRLCHTTAGDPTVKLEDKHVQLLNLGHK